MSSLVYAHYHAAVKAPSGLTLPLLQCHRQDLALRQEVQLLFQMLGIDGSGLCFLEDVAPSSLSTLGKLSVVLVDHNAPTGTQLPILVPVPTQVV